MISREDMLDWADMLDSGEHVQQSCGWGKAGRQCCIHVLAEAVDKDSDGDYIVYNLHSSSFSESQVFESAGCDKEQAWTLRCYFVRLNDKYKATFEEIADVIRAGDYPHYDKHGEAQ